MPYVLLIAVLAAACGRFGFEPNSDGSVIDGTLEVTRDATAPSAMLVQVAVNDVFNDTRLTTPLGSPSTPDDVVVVGISNSANGSSSCAITSVADDIGGTYTLAAIEGDTQAVALYCGRGGGAAITVAIVMPCDITVIALEYAGTSCTVDAANAVSTIANTSYATGAITTTEAPELLVVANFTNFARDVTYQSSDGFSQVGYHDNRNGETLETEQLIATTPGPYQDVGVTSLGAGYQGVLVAFAAP
jgi:hypothetical protein